MYMEPQNPIFRIYQSNAKEKEQTGGTTLSDSGQYYKATVIRTSKGCKRQVERAYWPNLGQFGH